VAYGRIQYLLSAWISVSSRFKIGFLAEGILFLVGPAFVESRYGREVEGRLAMERLEFRVNGARAA